MKLRLPHKFQAALIAALASVSLTTLSAGSALAEETAPLTFGADLGDVMYVGDSITHGIAAASWRWSMHKIFVDAGVSYDENGYNTGNDPGYSGRLEPGTPYGGVVFENVHSAHSGGDAFEVIGRAKRGSGHYGNSNIYNWLGVDKQLTVRGSSTGSYTGTVTENVDTFLMLIGTNDLLSAHTDKPTEIAGSASDALVTDIGNIYGVMQQTNPGSQLVLLSIPCWTDHGNNNSKEVHEAVVTANNKLKNWADSQANVTYADVNDGLIDVSSDIPFKGPRAFFRSPTGDGLHPNAQGEIIIAGNVAKAMGYAGRSVGLDRADAQHPGETAWHSIAEPVTVTGTAYDVPDVQFTTALGYTVDFNALYGNGGTDAWDNDHAFSVTVGDGIHSGTLSLTEAYVKWGDKLLYSKDNSQAGDNLRIAYVNASINASDNVSAGYYVWLGDKLIGEALTAGSASDGFNGIKLQSTGVDTTLSTLSWTDAAYAPTTTGYVNEAAAFHLVQVNPMPSHDNDPIPSTVDWTHATTPSYAGSGTARYAVDSAGTGDATTVSMTITGSANTSWLGAKGGNNTYTGDINLEIREGSLGAKTVFGLVNGGTLEGDATVELNSSTAVYGSFTEQTDPASLIGGYCGNITGTFTGVVNAGELQYGIIGGFHHMNSGNHIGAVDLIINRGTVGGNVYGGSIVNAAIDHDIAITVTGGKVNGSILGSGTAGSVGGNIDILVKGGVITGSITGKQDGVNVTGTTSVTIEGNRASIGGDISADTVTLKDVAPNAGHYTDGFDSYRGNISAGKLVLDNYTVERMLAGVETQSLVLSGESKTTIGNLTLTACDIHVDKGSELILDGVNTYGHTATYNGHVAIADGTTFNVLNAEMIGGASGYSDGDDGYANGTFVVFKQATDEPLVDGTGLYGTDGGALTDANTATFVGIGALTDAIFSYNGETGMLTADAQGTGGPYFVNTDHVVYSSTSTDYHAYEADDIRLNGGTLQFQEALRAGTALSVIKEGSGIIVDSGVSMAVNSIDAASLAEYGLTLTGTMTASTAAELTANLLGEDANITTTASITLNNNDATHAGGVLTIGDSLSLNLNGAKGNTYDISSFKQVVLGAGSTINYQAKSATFNNVTLATGDASISIIDMGDKTDMLTLAGQTQLNGHRLSITAPGTSWKRYVTIEKLVGDDASTLSFEGGKTDDGSGSKITINSLQGFGGTLELKENRTGNPLTATVNTGSGSAVNMKALSLTGTGEAVTVQGNADLSIGTLTVSKGSTLTVELNDYPSKHLNIGKLLTTGSGDAATRVEIYATTLTQGQTPHRIVVGSADESYSDENLYSGTLWVTTHQNQGASQPSTTDLLVNAQDVLRNTTLHLENWKSNYNNTRLLVSMGTDIRVAGIDSSNSGSASNSGTYIRSGELTATAPSAFADYYSTSPVARTFEITGSGTYSSSAYIMGKVNLAMSGSGSQTFTGNLSQFNGSINVTDGTLALTPNSSIATHAVNVGGEGTLTITTTGSNAITASATMHNEGTLNLTGTVKLDTVHMADFDMVEGSAAPVYSGVDRGTDHYANSGYLTTSAQYYLVKGTEGSTLTGTVTIDPATGSRVEQADDKSIVVTFKTNEEGGMFYVNDSFTYDTDMAAASDITIAKDKMLTVAGTAMSGKKLHGAGTYALASGSTSLGTNVTLDPTDWTGVVRVSGTIANLNINTLGSNIASTIEFAGMEGSFCDPSANTITLARDVVFTNAGEGGATPAIKITQGYSRNGSFLFSGNVSGDGTFLLACTPTQHITFSGDVSQWEGKFQVTNAGSNNDGSWVKFTGNAHEVNVEISKTGGTFRVIADTDVVFSKTISSDMEITAGHTATLSAAPTIGTLTGAGTLAYNGESAGTVAITGNLTNFTGSLVNESDEDMTVSLSANATTVKSDIASTGEGKVNLSLATNKDYNMYGTQSVNNIAHSANVTLKVRDNGNVTATGTVLTGRLVVGEASTETGAVFTLSDTGACLVTGGTDHRYTASVQGYGTFRVADGATQTLAPDASHNLTGFHGTFAAEGQDSVLTLNGALANDAKLLATDGGKVVLGTAVDSMASLTVESTGILKLSEKDSAAVSATTITLADGAVLDLSALGLTGVEAAPVVLLQGGTVDAANVAGIQVTYGENDVTRHSVLSVNEDNALQLAFESFDLVWDNNSASQYWTADANWHTGDGRHVRFYNGDDVRFVSSAAAPSPILGSDVSAGTMTVDSGVNLTLNTNGHNLTAANLVADGANLTKTGAGTATFNGEAVSLNKLAVNNGTAVFNEHVTVTGGTRVDVTGGSTATFANGLDYSGTAAYGLVIDGTSTAVLYGSSDLWEGGNGRLGIASGGKLIVGKDATLHASLIFNSTDNNGDVEVKEGGRITLGQDTFRTTTITNFTNAGKFEVTGNATAITNLDNSGTITLNRTATAAAESTVSGSFSNSGLITLVGTGATALAKMNVNSTAEQMDLGAFHLDNAEIHIGSNDGESRVRNFSTITVDGAGKLTQTSWNNLMHIVALDDGDGGGERSFTWSMNTDHWTNSVLYLDGAGTFSGTFTAQRESGTRERGAYQGHLQINAGGALANAVLNVTGANSGNNMSVALNADKVETAGVTGNANTIIYAGEANTSVNSGAGSAAPVSTREGGATLAMNVADAATAHEFAGKVESGVSLEKLGEGTQVFSGDMSHFNGSVSAENGTLNVLNADSLAVKDVHIGERAVFGVYSSDTAAATTDTEGSIAITEEHSLTVLKDATLNANLIMEAGSKLDVHAAQFGNGLHMGSKVTLEYGTLLTNNELGEPVANFNEFLFDYLKAEGAPEYYSLYNDVEEFYLQQGEISYKVETLQAKDWLHIDLDASKVFGNLTENTFALVYNWDEEHRGHVALVMIPEPTTGTLSLLALCALAARRRRH